MNREQVQGAWNELKGKVRTKWSKLTDSDIEAIRGKTDELVGRIQKTYGLKKDQVERDVDEWLKHQ